MAVHLGLIQYIGEVSMYVELGLLKEDPVKTVLKEDAQPYSVAAPRHIPIAKGRRGVETNGREWHNRTCD